MTCRWVIAALCAAAPACNETAPDGSGIVFEVLADQPSSPGFGVSLAVHARGGTGLSVAVEQGSFVAQDSSGIVPETSACLPSPAADPADEFTIVLSVRPAESEAVLFGTLYEKSDCTGTDVQSRVLAVHPPAANAVDAGMTQKEAP